MHMDPGRSSAASAGREASFSGKAWKYLLPRKRFRPLSAHRSVKSCGQVYFFHSRILRPVRRFPLFYLEGNTIYGNDLLCSLHSSVHIKVFTQGFLLPVHFHSLAAASSPETVIFCFIHTFQPASAAVRLAVGCHRRGLYLTYLHSVRTAAHKCTALRKL